MCTKLMHLHPGDSTRQFQVVAQKVCQRLARFGQAQGKKGNQTLSSGQNLGIVTIACEKGARFLNAGRAKYSKGAGFIRTLLCG
jgi:hypothetical protein